MVISSEDNRRKTSVFVLLMLRAFVYAYVPAVLTSVMLMLMSDPFSLDISAVMHPLMLMFILMSPVKTRLNRLRYILLKTKVIN